MVISNYSKKKKIILNFKSEHQKREGSHFSASYGEKFSQQLFKFETREMGIFHTFFSLGKIFLTEKESREAQHF
jgi:hypothetical protein